ncbi:MAG: hypothetical protein Kow0068_03790 [Marinilabiliales bacterium]
MIKLRRKILRLLLYIAGFTGIIFLLEACYGPPANYYIDKYPVKDNNLDTNYIDSIPKNIQNQR